MSARDEWACPKCGSDQGVFVTRRVTGIETWRVTADPSRREIVDEEKRYRSLPKFGTCSMCNARVKVHPAA
jgi:hypothetical protein